MAMEARKDASCSSVTSRRVGESSRPVGTSEYERLPSTCGGFGVGGASAAVAVEEAAVASSPGATEPSAVARWRVCAGAAARRARRAPEPPR